MKRIISILLAVFMAIAISFVGATPASAARTDEVVATIEAYNSDHGGIGNLVAEVTGANEVTVTGSVIDAKKSLNLTGSGMSIILWKATLIGNSSDDIFFDVDIHPIVIHEGGYVSSTNPTAICCYGMGITVAGGTVVGNLSSGLADLFITGGTVTGDMYASYLINISGGTITGSLSAGDNIAITGGLTNASKIDTMNYLKIGSSATVNLSDPSKLYARAIYIAPGATTANFPITNFIKAADEDFNHFTVCGNVERGGFFIERRGTLVIAKGASLHILYELTISGGSLIIDGVFTYDETASLDLHSGLIKGKNAGPLAGIYGNPVWDMLPPCLQQPLFRALVWLKLDELFMQVTSMFA